MAPSGSRMNDIRLKLKSFYERFISLRGEPEKIAMGMAIGIFIGVMPVIPFHTVLIICIGYLARQNIIAAYLGSWIISNPLTIPFFYVGEYYLGKLMLGMSKPCLVFVDYSVLTIVKQGWQAFVPLFTGGLIMAPIFAIPAYFITYRLVIALRNRLHNASHSPTDN